MAVRLVILVGPILGDSSDSLGSRLKRLLHLLALTWPRKRRFSWNRRFGLVIRHHAHGSREWGRDSEFSGTFLALATSVFRNSFFWAVLLLRPALKMVLFRSEFSIHRLSGALSFADVDFGTSFPAAFGTRAFLVQLRSLLPNSVGCTSVALSAPSLG